MRSCVSATTGADASKSGRLALRLGSNQVARIGMLRRLEQLLGRLLLDDQAVLHHVDALRHPPHDAEIVRDEQHRHAHLPLQVAQEFEDLGLNGDVERRRRLVGNQQIRLVRQRHGDHYRWRCPPDS